MILSERMFKWVMRFYPPLFFQRIWVVRFDDGFSGVHVKIKKSVLNKNYNNSIFGGTIFSAADPFYPVLFHQQLTGKGYRVIAWSKSSQVQYLKPCKTDVYFKIELQGHDITECQEVLNTSGKFTKNYQIDMYDKKGELCVSVIIEVYVRDLNFDVGKTDPIIE